MWDAPKLLAIDPRGCGCTECLTGEYRPLEDATTEEIQALFLGEVQDNTSAVWLIVGKEQWSGSGFTVYADGLSFDIDKITLPIPVEHYRLDAGMETIQAIADGANHLD